MVKTVKNISVLHCASWVMGVLSCCLHSEGWCRSPGWWELLRLVWNVL